MAIDGNGVARPFVIKGITSQTFEGRTPPSKGSRSKTAAFRGLTPYSAAGSTTAAR